MNAFETKEVLLSVKNVSKNYDVPILRDINLEINNLTRVGMTQGQIVSLIGKSGSGKSTLFRLMAGIEKANTGSIEMWNYLPNNDHSGYYSGVKEGNMGVVFQNSYVYPWRKVRKILSMAAEKNVQKVDIQHYVDILSLGDHMDKYANQLSGGQRQRVAIAEQILTGGQFILMDEPFSGLDALTIDKVTETLTKLVLEDERKTVVLISHDLSNSLAISDTAFILAKEGDLPGTTITNKICLASMGLAWQPNIKENPEFRNLLKYVKEQL